MFLILIVGFSKFLKCNIMEMTITKEQNRLQPLSGELPCCGFCYLVKIDIETKLDAYWLKEDLLEALPDAKCDFVDDSFQLLKITSALPLRVSEMKSVFKHYKMNYSIVDAKKSRKQEPPTEVLNSILSLI